MCEKQQRELLLVRPAGRQTPRSQRLSQVLESALAGVSFREVTGAAQLPASLEGRRLLFAIEQGEAGINLEYYEFLKELRLGKSLLDGAAAGVLVDGDSELFTKSLARELVFSANQAGCAFPGRPLVEGTATLQNFDIQARVQSTDNLGAYKLAARRLTEQLLEFQLPKKPRPKLLVLHANNVKTSNTAALWEMVKESLDAVEITEISLRNGTVADCGGCPFSTCLHFGEKERCYYGGVIVEQVYPAVRDCDGLVMLCPNYNDAVSANLTAFINRLTALFRKMQFYDKYLFGLVVSGYSGGDIVAGQLISALNMNKTFILPPRFAMLETANNPGSILRVTDIKRRAKDFGEAMVQVMVQK